jgi:hypothetical protein
VRKSFWQTARGERELEELAERFPSLRFCPPVGEAPAFVTGTFFVSAEVGYTTELELPAGYPSEVPILHCNRDEIPWELDRHVVTQNGHACLCARSEYRLHWPEGSSLSDFIERLVRPYFLGQFYHETHGCWPPTGARSHGLQGIIEAYAELSAPLGDTSRATMIRLMGLLSRKNDPKGHEICPCGSARPLRHCHRAEVTKLRRSVRPEDAATDLEHVLRFPSHPGT